MQGSALAERWVSLHDETLEYQRMTSRRLCRNRVEVNPTSESSAGELRKTRENWVTLGVTGAGRTQLTYSRFENDHNCREPSVSVGTAQSSSVGGQAGALRLLILVMALVCLWR